MSPDPPSRSHSLANSIEGRHTDGDGTEWFDDLYAESRTQRIDPPWAKRAPNANLTDWLDEKPFEGAGRRALVIGCGLGDDAEELARRGFEVTAIDVSKHAIEMARERFPETRVEYQPVNLLEPPAAMVGGFDLVWEAYTLQSLPTETRRRAMAQLARLPVPGGVLLVAAYARPEASEPPDGPPFPLVESELRGFAELGLTLERFESYVDEKRSGRPIPHHRAELHR